QFIRNDATCTVFKFPPPPTLAPAAPGPDGKTPANRPQSGPTSLTARASLPRRTSTPRRCHLAHRPSKKRTARTKLLRKPFPKCGGGRGGPEKGETRQPPTFP